MVKNQRVLKAVYELGHISQIKILIIEELEALEKIALFMFQLAILDRFYKLGIKNK